MKGESWREGRKITKRKTSKKQKVYFEDIPILESKKKGTAEHKPSDFFKAHDKVAAALLQSLEDNDAGAFLEILDAYHRDCL